MLWNWVIFSFWVSLLFVRVCEIDCVLLVMLGWMVGFFDYLFVYFFLLGFFYVEFEDIEFFKEVFIYDGVVSIFIKRK